MSKQSATIITIARALGVSPSTVSRAFVRDSRISPLMRQRVLDCAASVGYRPNRSAARLSAKEIKLGVLIQDSFPALTSELLRGVEDALGELYDCRISCAKKVFSPKLSTLEEYRGLLGEMRDRDALILCGFAGEAGSAAVREATRFSTVVLLQSDLPDSGRLFASVQNVSLASAMAAEFLFGVLRRGGRRVTVFTGRRELAVHRRAVTAFAQRADALGLEVADFLDMRDDPLLLDAMAREVLRHPPDGIYITSGISSPLCERVRQMKERPALVTFDAFREILPYLRDGTVLATVYQDLYGQAYRAVEELVKYLLDGVRPEDVIQPPPLLLFPSTVSLYLPREAGEEREEKDAFF